MIDRLRELLDRPLDPSAVRAILVFASAILVGFAALFVLAVSRPDQPTSSTHPSVSAAPPSPVVSTQVVEGNPAEAQAAPRRQDPQDVEGSLAAHRADRARRSHRAIQHLPYRRGKLAVTLAGARGDRALLRVSAPNLRAARRGWRAFLRRYHDRGKAYIARFVTHGGGRSR
ncbi:MAG TPA: hypothetical protein VFN85_09165 [Solirubrobacterales bacterium]|nr:hypothetical protein [Solirubrobacterales bacterium]